MGTQGRAQECYLFSVLNTAEGLGFSDKAHANLSWEPNSEACKQRASVFSQKSNISGPTCLTRNPAYSPESIFKEFLKLENIQFIYGYFKVLIGRVKKPHKLVILLGDFPSLSPWIFFLSFFSVLVEQARFIIPGKEAKHIQRNHGTS